MIGIVTITDGFNYGNRLQNYAVQTVLEDIGADSATIFLKMTNKRKLKNLIKRLLGMQKQSPALKKRSESFSLFNKENLRMVRVGRNALPKLDKRLDYAVCGSDQVWNFNFGQIKYFPYFYFAEFVEKEKRVALSASIGTNNVPDDCIDAFVEGINGMKSISVREERGSEIIKKLADRDVPVTVDPTLMLSREEWKKVEKKPSFVKDGEKYILTYFLGGFSKEVRDYVELTAQKSGLKIIDLYYEWTNENEIGNSDWFAAGPAEFVWLIDHCELLMTDSFHGCIFSIINKVPFRCFERYGNKAADMSSRMTTLFGKLDINSWCWGDISEDVDRVFYSDYSSTDEKIEKEKKFAYDYLKGALNIK